MLFSVRDVIVFFFPLHLGLPCCCFSFFFVLSVSAATSAAAVTGNGEGGGKRGRHAVPAVLVQPSGGNLRNAAGLPLLRLLGAVVG